MKSIILITGVAGFIGYHTAKKLLEHGYFVIGIDNLDPYYDVGLKKARLNNLTHENFIFYYSDITDNQALNEIIDEHPSISHVIHLAAKSGVRHSLDAPEKYVQTNIIGQLSLLQACRRLSKCHLIYASSSSVYGGNTKVPFSVSDPVNMPLSPYAATKRSAELMSYAYSHLFGIQCTGLRFFTVYGPWGRPDMATFIFTKAIFEEKEFAVFNHGNMARNFTYIDDIVQGIISCFNLPLPENGAAPYRLYNLGGDRSENLLDFVKTLEHAIGKKAHIRLESLQAGDVPATVADISTSQRDLNFFPKVSIKQGLQAFVSWYKEYYYGQ